MPPISGTYHSTYMGRSCVEYTNMNALMYNSLCINEFWRFTAQGIMKVQKGTCTSVGFKYPIKDDVSQSLGVTASGYTNVAPSTMAIILI